MQGSQQVLWPDQKDKEGKVSPDVAGKWKKAALGLTKNAVEYQNGIGRDVGTEGEDALVPLRQVLGRVDSLGEAVILGVSEPEEGELEKETTTSDEEMQEEIRETQAAVDACYRRRAEHAGIKVKPLKDRLLTEEELDNLSEQLGDGVGAQAKRRREIEQMSIAEMEAEAEEVQEEVKRRKGRKASRLPLVLMLLCLSGQAVEEFTAYDCFNRSNIVESYSLLEPDVCANMGKEGEVETKVYREIVQIKQDRMIPVFRCVVIETIVSQYCGMFSVAGVARYIRFWEPRNWRPGNAVRQGKAGKSSSTAKYSRARSGQQPLTACS
jgi:hypothetical protein